MRQELDDLLALRNGITPQTRGRRFERWLNQLLSQSDLAPRTAFRPDGEEVDGSFVHGHRTYLLEAKWLKDEVPASAIYQFKGKVDGKLVGTIGTFISMSGYSRDAVDALRVGKNLNVVLFDRSDIDQAVRVGFAEVFDFKLRQAAEKGEVFIPYEVVPDAEVAPSPGVPLTVVVEGAADASIIRGIAENLSRSGTPTRDLQIIVARGVMGMSHIAEAAAQARGGDVLAIADSDGHRTTIPHLDMLQGQNIETIIVDPWIEKWLGFSSPAEARQVPRREIPRRVASIDVADLAARDPEFGRLIKILSA
ncbi:restriction endonuclease [Streptomyces shenzhenensis]|uniref:restriction endonuclease n=1 Tax=Streptomyces shenzhenensis TaxID=943815 RepID=UPI00340AB428